MIWPLIITIESIRSEFSTGILTFDLTHKLFSIGHGCSLHLCENYIL